MSGSSAVASTQLNVKRIQPSAAENTGLRNDAAEQSKPARRIQLQQVSVASHSPSGSKGKTPRRVQVTVLSSPSQRNNQMVDNVSTSGTVSQLPDKQLPAKKTDHLMEKESKGELAKKSTKEQLAVEMFDEQRDNKSSPKSGNISKQPRRLTLTTLSTPEKNIVRICAIFFSS